MPENIKRTFTECVLHNAWFKILSLSSLILIFISLLLPPLGVIDPSVVAATGELLGWGSLWTVLVAIDKGKAISVKHNGTEIDVRKRKEEEKIEEED